MSDKKIVLNASVVNSLINYMIQKPYNEVAILLQNLQKNINENNLDEDKKEQKVS